MSCQLFSPLVDEQPVLIRWFGFLSVFIDIVFDQDTCFRPKWDLAKAVALAQYGKGSLVRVCVGIKILEME